MPTASRYANPRSNRRSGGLWELRYEPGPNFPWGVVARRSMLNADGREESTQDQGLETVRYIKDNKLGRIVRSYTDIASGFHEDANRPDYENALDDLRAASSAGLLSGSLTGSPVAFSNCIGSSNYYEPRAGVCFRWSKRSTRATLTSNFSTACF